MHFVLESARQNAVWRISSKDLLLYKKRVTNAAGSGKYGIARQEPRTPTQALKAPSPSAVSAIIKKIKNTRTI